MGDEIVFTIRLTSDDWDAGIRAWRCPAVDIPSAFIKEAYDPKGQPLATSLLKIDKGPARVSWKGPGQPAQIVLVVELGEKLSPTSEGLFWKRLAIVVPIITALIGAGAAYATKPGPKPGPDPTPKAYTLRLHVYPNEIETSGLPPAKITVNNQEPQRPIAYKVESDVDAVVDVSKAFVVFKNQNNVVAASASGIDTLFKQLNDLNSHVNGDICSGGGSGTPSPVRGSLSAQTTAITDKLRGIRSELGGTLSNGPTVPK
jgi:hypothetical protein